MRIMVRTLRGERVALDVDGETPVAQVKGMVMGRERIPVGMQRLIFAGRQLEDDRPLADYGIQQDSVVFLSLRLRAVTTDEQEMQNVQMRSEMVKKELQQQIHIDQIVEIPNDQKKRQKISHHSLRKILSQLKVDIWTSQHDKKFLDLVIHYTNSGERNVSDLTVDDWSSICTRLNGDMGSNFALDELQRRLCDFRREFEIVNKIKNHPKFTYDPRRRLVIAKEADWQQYILENPEAVSYEGKSPHFNRLKAIFSSDGEDIVRSGNARIVNREESRAKRYLRKLLQNFGLHW